MNDWLLRRTRRPGAAYRLYCFPYAGGSPGEFLRWESRLPQAEIWGVLPPGRGRRYVEEPFTRATELVETLIADVSFQAPFILFGHSLGALLAYETARALQAASRPGPLALVVSAHRPPHLPHVDEFVHDLPEGRFGAEIARRYPAPPPELSEDPEFLAGFHRMLRGDLEVFETYRHVPGATLTCDIAVIGALDDHWSEDELAGWSVHTSAGCRVTMVPGGHHYLPGQPDGVLKVIAELGDGVVR